MKMKRIMSVFLTIVMVMSMVTVPVNAEDAVLSCTKTVGCTLTDGHSEECVVSQEITYCSDTTCLLHKAQIHDACAYCETEACLLKGEAHTECKLPEASASCCCVDKCQADAVNGSCAVCAAATVDALASVCTGSEAVAEKCDATGCELAKGHPGEHTGAGNFVQCDGAVTPESCDATEHDPGCSKFSVKDQKTLLAALGADMTEIVLADGFTITQTVVIPKDKDITLDMADKTITVAADVNPAIRVLGKLTVKNGKMDTATGDEADGYCFIVGGTEEEIAGTLTIESGTYHGASSAVSVTKGTANINGGSFSAEPADGMEDSRYVLNCYDANYQAGTASIVVTGGTFSGFNPANNLAEGENTTFLAENHCVKENEETFMVARHSLSHVPAAAATCLAAGNLEHWKCSHCGKLYDAAENGQEVTAESIVLPLGGHDLEEQQETEATCTTNGNIVHWKCITCGKLFDEANNELAADEVVTTDGPHQLELQEAVTATCQTEGNIAHYKCSECDALFEDEAGTASLTAEQVKTTGTHDLNYQGGQPATYDTDGILAHYYCDVAGCGKKFADVRGDTELTESTVLPMLSHAENGVLVIDEDAIANEGKKNVVLDLLQDKVMGNLSAVREVQFQKSCLAEHVEQGGTLRICLSDAEVYFDNNALKTIVEKAKGDTVTLLVEEITKTASVLTAKQKTAFYSQKDPYLLRLELSSGGKKITDDFGGNVYIYMTGFTPKSGYKNSDYSGYLMKEDGTTEKVSYYSRDARLTVKHFSIYFLSRNVKPASNPTTGDTSNVLVWAGVGLGSAAALAVLLILSRKRKNK